MIQNDEHSNIFIEWCISRSQIQVVWMITNMICQSPCWVHATHMRWMLCWMATGRPWGRTPNTPHHPLPPTRMQSWYKRENRSNKALITCTIINAFVLFCLLRPSHFHLTVTKNCQNLTQRCWCNSVRVLLYAYLPYWKVLKHFNICPLWIWEAIKGGLEPQPWHHGIISTQHHPEFPKSDPSLAVSRYKGALIRLCTSLKGKLTLHIRPIWMCEAIKGGLQPQPWHHGIISTRQSPRIAKIWPSFGSVTV